MSDEEIYRMGIEDETIGQLEERLFRLSELIYRLTRKLNNSDLEPLFAQLIIGRIAYLDRRFEITVARLHRLKSKKKGG